MEIRLPRLGEGANSGIVASILVKEGEKVRKDQTLLELESDKAVATIPVPQAGTIGKIHIKEGDEIKVGDLILTLNEDGSNGAAQAKAATVSVTAPASKPAQRQAAVSEEGPPIARPLVEGIPVAASPSVRKFSLELGIDLTRVRGSERGGRIVMDDIRRYIMQLQQQASQAQPVSQKTEAQVEQYDFARWGSVSKKKITTIRKTIAQRMAASWNTVPHVTQFDDADVSALLALRKKHSAMYERKGGRLTLTPLIIKAIVKTLQQHPKFNCSLDESAGEIVFKDYYNIGIAVDTDQGLLVPVLRDADKKSILDIAMELENLAAKARERKISLEEMQGGTFTISNQGGIGGAHFTPIVNKPEVAILGLGRGGMKPVVRGTKIEKRMLLPLGLSYDHRVIDGADAARFITTLVSEIESFDESLLSIGRESSKKPVKKGKK